jgi:hypothetical protein
MRITGNSEIQVDRGDFWTAQDIKFTGSDKTAVQIKHHFFLKLNLCS